MNRVATRSDGGDLRCRNLDLRDVELLLERRPSADAGEAALECRQQTPGRDTHLARAVGIGVHRAHEHRQPLGQPAPPGPGESIMQRRGPPGHRRPG